MLLLSVQDCCTDTHLWNFHQSLPPLPSPPLPLPPLSPPLPSPPLPSPPLPSPPLPSPPLPSPSPSPSAPTQPEQEPHHTAEVSYGGLGREVHPHRGHLHAHGEEVWSIHTCDSHVTECSSDYTKLSIIVNCSSGYYLPLNSFRLYPHEAQCLKW